MEEFYRLLTEYNIKLHQSNDLPDWHKIYTEPSMPIYLKILLEQLEKMDRKLSIIEVGSGFGDVLAMLIHLGFQNVVGIESNIVACQFANEKINYLFRTNAKYIRCAKYPVKLNYSPDIYIQVNNVYSGEVSSKPEFLKRSKDWIQYNGNPMCAFIEFIDESYIEESIHFPICVRISKGDVERMFSNYKINDFKTYEYPRNTSTKCLYRIETSRFDKQ